MDPEVIGQAGKPLFDKAAVFSAVGNTLLQGVGVVVHKRVTVLSSFNHRVQELHESRGGRHGLPVPNTPYGFCGRKETLKQT